MHVQSIHCHIKPYPFTEFHSMIMQQLALDTSYHQLVHSKVRCDSEGQNDWGPRNFAAPKFHVNFTCFVKVCIHTCPLNSFSSDDLCLEHTHFFTWHLSLSTTEIADNWRLGRVRIAADENQVLWTVLAPSLFIGLCCPRIGSFV